MLSVYFQNVEQIFDVVSGGWICSLFVRTIYQHGQHLQKRINRYFLYCSTYIKCLRFEYPLHRVLPEVVCASAICPNFSSVRAEGSQIRRSKTFSRSSSDKRNFSKEVGVLSICLGPLPLFVSACFHMFIVVFSWNCCSGAHHSHICLVEGGVHFVYYKIWM